MHAPPLSNRTCSTHNYFTPCFFNNNCCQCLLLLLLPGLSKRAPGGAGCALSRSLRTGTTRKAQWDFALFRSRSVGARWFTQAQPAPTISCNCVESLGAVVGCQQLKKSEVLPPEARPAGTPLAHPSPQSRALGQWCTAP